MSDDKSDQGVPDGAVEAEPTGTPTSDRHHAETSSHKDGGKKDAAKDTGGG